MRNLFLLLLMLLLRLTGIAQYQPVVWSNKIQAVTQLNPYCNIRAIAVDTNGYVYTAGSFDDSVRFDKNLPSSVYRGDETTESGYFAKYNTNGVLQWAKVLNGAYLPISDMCTDRFNNIYIAGHTPAASSIDFDLGPGVANLQFDGNDFFMAKYDSDGNYLWAKVINVGNGNSVWENKVHVIYVDSNLNVYLGGQFQNTIDIDPGTGTTTLTNSGGSNCNCTNGFYAKYDNNGNLLWGRLDARNAAVRDLHVHNATGKIALACERSTNSATSLRLVSASGLGMDSLNGGRISGTGVRFDASGNIYYSGFFSSSNNDFDWSSSGTSSLSTQASYEYMGFVAKYNSAAQFQWVKAYSPTNDTTYTATLYEVNVLPDGNPIMSFAESNGNNIIKGFYKLNAANGNALWNTTAFNVWVGATYSAAIANSPKDGSFIFAFDAGFNGNNSLYNIDINPNPQVTDTLGGRGYWSAFVKYGNCVAPPMLTDTISGPNVVCSSNQLTYSITPILGATSYNWVLPNGWTGNSDSSSISVQPSLNGGNISVSAVNQCGVSSSVVKSVQFFSTANTFPTASDTTVCLGTSVILKGNGANTYTWSNGVTDNVPFVPTSTTLYSVTATLENCSAIDTLTVFVLQPSATPISASICSGQSYLFNGSNYSVSGIYKDTLTNAAGCDSIVTLNLSVNQLTGSSINAAICPGNSYFFDGINYIAPGTYYDTLVNANGCDSIITLNLTFKPTSASSISASICAGQSYFFNDLNRTTAGIYKDTLTNAVGCDSIITLALSIKQKTSSSFNASICPGQTYQFNGAALNTAGTYKDTLINTLGCDSVITLNLSLLPTFNTSVMAAICEGDTYGFAGQQLSIAGTYYDTLVAFNSGCDSIVTLSLEVGASVISTLNETICEGQSYSFNGTLLNTAGTYADTLSASGGCDSIVTLELVVLEMDSPVIYHDGNMLATTAFAGYQWFLNGNPIQGANQNELIITATGNYTVEVTDGFGCKDTSEVYNVQSVGIGETSLTLNNIKLYPNPTTGNFTIDFVDNLLREVTITDGVGKVVVQTTLAAKKMQFYVSHLATGVYFIHVKQQEQRATIKLNIIK